LPSLSSPDAFGLLLFAGDAVCCGFDDGPASPSPALGRDRGSEMILWPFPVFGGIVTVCAVVMVSIEVRKWRATRRSSEGICVWQYLLRWMPI